MPSNEEKMPNTKQKSVIIIGAGAGGIATAARLAKNGLKVTVLEKNNFTGGRCSLLHHEGYRFDQGPSLLLLPKLFRETFYDLDTSLEDEGVELLKCSPINYKVWFGDGEALELSTDLARMKALTEQWEGATGNQWLTPNVEVAWLREAHAHYELSVKHVLNHNFVSWWHDMFDPTFIFAALLRLHPFESVWSRACRYFRSERLRRLFTFATMYMGMSPFDAPGTYSLLQYTELTEGIWYPRGGFHVVLDALVKVGERLGVRYRLGEPVRRIIASRDGGKAKGVMLESGEVLEADMVVVNADLVYAYSNLFPKTSELEKYARSLRKKDESCSSISFYWSVDRKIPELHPHNIFLADEYRESFDAIFDRQSLPDEPSFYINVPSRIDPTAAPEGRDAVIALVPVGHLLHSKGFPPQTSQQKPNENDDNKQGVQDWPALVSRARSAVLSTIQKRTGCAPLSQCILHEQINDPHDWESKFNLDKGAILGLSHSFFNVLKFRPGTRARGPLGHNVYFVGASTHPGTGVPIVLAGARLTAEQVLGDCGVRPSWSGRVSRIRDQGVLQTAGTGSLDRVDSWRDVLVWVGLVVVLVVLHCYFVTYFFGG